MNVTLDPRFQSPEIKKKSKPKLPPKIRSSKIKKQNEAYLEKTIKAINRRNQDFFSRILISNQRIPRELSPHSNSSFYETVNFKFSCFFHSKNQKTADFFLSSPKDKKNCEMKEDSFMQENPPGIQSSKTQKIQIFDENERKAWKISSLSPKKPIQNHQKKQSKKNNGNFDLNERENLLRSRTLSSNHQLRTFF